MAPARVLLTCVVALVALPAQSPAPLPDQEPFFAEVRKRLASNDLLLSGFSFRERTTELRLNPFGRIGTGPVRVYDVYPHPNDELTYRRLVEEDGRPLGAVALAEQDREYRERLADWERRLGREGASARQARLEQVEEARKKDQARAAEALELFTFAIEGRARYAGEPAIIIGFTPRPDVSPRSREGRVAHVFTGQAWVHEHEYEVMQVEAEAIDDVSFGFGLIARLHKGSTVRFTRRRVGTTWLPESTHFEGTGRAVLVRKVIFDFSREYSNYRAFKPAELPMRLGWER